MINLNFTKKYLKGQLFDPQFLIILFISFIFFGNIVGLLSFYVDQDFTRTYILEKIKCKELKLNEMLSENLKLEELLQEQQLYVNIIGFCVFLE